MTNSSWVTLFQCLSLAGSILALVSFIGLWVFTSRLETEKELKIEQLQDVTDAVRAFSDVSRLDPTGAPFRGSGIQYNSALCTALRDLYIDTGNDPAHFKLGREFEPRYRAVIDQFPRFPFGYFALTESLRNRGDPTWREYAEKAVTILEKTTSIEGHEQSHDQALKILRRYLAQK
jgi:hypothetical protein